MGDPTDARRAPASADASLGRPGNGTRSRPPRITLILAAPGPMFGLGLRAPLDDCDEFEIQEAADLAALVALAGRARAPAIALVDLDLPPAGGAAAVTSVRDSVAAPVVWCSGSRLTPDVVYKLVRSGAVGILRKETAVSGVVRTLRAAGNGEAPLPRDLVAGLLNQIHSLASSPAPTPPTIATLSMREREVLALVARGYSNKTIANKLHISEFMAKRHVQDMLNKLALHRRQDAATRFREEVKAGVSGAYSFEPEES